MLTATRPQSRISHRTSRATVRATLPLRQPFAKVGPRRGPHFPGLCATVGLVNAPAPGTELVGGYRLGPPVAQGAMGSIYEAVDPDGRRVAAKRLLDERHAARFEIEGRLLSRLHHPRVVEVLGMVEDASGRYLMMEWVEGDDLAHVLRRDGKPGLPEDQVIKITLEAAEALRYVHEQQTIHRDVKPQNLMLSPDRGIVLVDFGIARDLAADSATQAPTGAAENARFYSVAPAWAGRILYPRPVVDTTG